MVDFTLYTQIYEYIQISHDGQYFKCQLDYKISRYFKDKVGEIDLLIYLCDQQTFVCDTAQEPH